MRFSILTFLTCFYVVLVSSQGQQSPAITFISPDIVTDIGGNVQLTCTIHNGKEYPILWMRLGGKREPFPISTGPSLLVHDKRFSLENDPETGSYVLSIRDVQKTDEARYQCQVVVSLNNMVTADVELKVKVPPVISEDVPLVKRVTAGDSAELSCDASGFPSPKITWRRKEGILLPTGKETHTATKLTITKARSEDRGNYICSASNGVGKTQERVISLEVEFPPKIDVPKPKVPQAAFYEAHLVCEIQAFPPPAINWKRGDAIINNNASFHISHFASADERTTSTLKVLSVTKEQFGKYTCEASNRHGTASQHMDLYESQMAICPPVCGKTNLNGVSRADIPFTIILFAVLAVLTFK